MENASKALLIAGAVLIVILIIGVGMAIYTGATGTINSSIGQMDAQQIQMFNQQFKQYEGDRVQGSRVKTLISTVDSNKATNPDMEMTVNGGTGIKTTKQYKVTVTDTNNDGLVDTIDISLASVTTTP